MSDAFHALPWPLRLLLALGLLAAGVACCARAFNDPPESRRGVAVEDLRFDPATGGLTQPQQYATPPTDVPSRRERRRRGRIWIYVGAPLAGLGLVGLFQSLPSKSERTGYNF